MLLNSNQFHSIRDYILTLSRLCVFAGDKDYLQTPQPRVQVDDADVATLELMVEHLPRQLTDRLTQRLAEKKRKDNLPAVDVFGDTRAVWMRESTEWVKLCDVPDECPDHCSVGVSHVSDGIVVAGGWLFPCQVRSQCHHFSPSTGQWRQLENMRTPRYWSSAAEVEEMLLLVVGGSVTGGRESDVCEWLNIRRGVWTPAASLPKPLSCPLVAAASGRAYILQECSVAFKPSFLFLEYDPVLDIHTQKTSVPHHARDTWHASMVGIADCIYLFGGETKVSLQHKPATQQWHELVPTTSMVNTGYYPIVRSTDILLCSGERKRSISYNVETKQWKILDFCLPFKYK